MPSLDNDLDLKDACAELAKIIERTENCRDAVERSGKLNRVDTTFLTNGAERELAALNLAMACLLLARGETEQAKDTFFGAAPAKLPDAPKPAPVAPPRTFRPLPVPPRYRSPKSEISF